MMEREICIYGYGYGYIVVYDTYLPPYDTVRK